MCRQVTLLIILLLRFVVLFVCLYVNKLLDLSELFAIHIHGLRFVSKVIKWRQFLLIKAVQVILFLYAKYLSFFIYLFIFFVTYIWKVLMEVSIIQG